MTPPERLSKIPQWELALEYALIFLAAPIILFFHATRWNVHVVLWVAALYAFVKFKRSHLTSWHDVWHGTGWSLAHRKAFLLRFVVATIALVIITSVFFPERFFMFPLLRPWFWLMVMILYPLLSVLPQEFIFRSFFFRRYETLFPRFWISLAVNVLSFGFMHIVFHNMISPLLCLIAGVLFAYSYQQHRALKWVVLEHAAYGCMVFTVGLGSFFFVNSLPH